EARGRFRICNLCFVVWFLIWFLAAPTLTGRVTDTAGKPVTAAMVRAVSDSGAVLETTTDAKGRFRLEISGRFRLEISHPDYRTLRSSPVTLTGDSAYILERISLLGGTPDQVETVDLPVQASTEALDHDEPGARETLPRADRLFGSRGGINVTGIAEGAGQQ